MRTQGKFFVQGPDAAALVERVFAANVVRGNGSVSYSHMINEAAGIEGDAVVTQLAEDKFLVAGASGARGRDVAWLSRVRKGWTPTTTTTTTVNTTTARPFTPLPNALVADVTEHFACLGVFGPKACALLSGLTSTPLDAASFPYGTAREIIVYGRPVIAQRMSYAGSPGFELFVDRNNAADVYTVLQGAGADYNLRPCGSLALDALRLEKCYLAPGRDASAAETPRNVGLAWSVSHTKAEAGTFVGAAAWLSQQGAAGAAAGANLISEMDEAEKEKHMIQGGSSNVKLVSATVNGTSGYGDAGGGPLLTPGDPIVVQQGGGGGDSSNSMRKRRSVGYVTSVAHSATYDTTIIMAHVLVSGAGSERDQGRLAVLADGHQLELTLLHQPLHDPDGTEMKA